MILNVKIDENKQTNKQEKMFFVNLNGGKQQQQKNEEIFLYTGILIAPNNEICKIDWFFSPKMMMMMKNQFVSATNDWKKSMEWKPNEPFFSFDDDDDRGQLKKKFDWLIEKIHYWWWWSSVSQSVNPINPIRQSINQTNNP